jgi:hypothetical protein
MVNVIAHTELTEAAPMDRHQTEAVHTDGTRLPVTFSIQASFSVLIRNNWVTKSERIAWADPKAQRSRPSSLAFSHE